MVNKIVPSFLLMAAVVGVVLGVVGLLLSDSVGATTAAIMVGDMLGGLAEDPDGNVGDTPPITDMYPNITGATWQWAKTMTPDMMDSWMDITGATDAAYMVMDDDEGYHLRATAMYDDGEAHDFAHTPLTDDREAIREGLTCSLEVADYFGVPEGFVRVQTPLAFRRRADETVR